MRSSAGAAGLAVLLLAGGAVGCGGKDKAASPEMKPAAAVAAAAKNAEKITSLSYRMSGKVPGEGQIEGEAAMNVDPPAMSMKMSTKVSGASQKVEIRLVDKAMYIGGGAEMAKEMDGKLWMKFDMSMLDSAGKAHTNQFGAGQAQQNPATESGFLTESDDVKKVGTETVDGVKTTHYEGTVPLADIRASLKGEDKATREKRDKSLKQFEKMGVDKLTMDMWIDGEQHTKQFRMRADADKGPLDLKILFLDYNKPVTVTAPPAKDVMDLAEMMKEAGTDS
ncbi:LolA-like protein [Streptomyces sp. YIM S03343]